MESVEVSSVLVVLLERIGYSSGRLVISNERKGGEEAVRRVSILNRKFEKFRLRNKPKSQRHVRKEGRSERLHRRDSRDQRLDSLSEASETSRKELLVSGRS